MSDHRRTTSPEDSTLEEKVLPYLETIDISDLFMNYYSKQKTVGFESQFEMIEEWLRGDWENNAPLVLFSKTGQGKKVFTVQWIEHHLQNSTKEFRDVIIPIFVTFMHTESSPFTIIYKLLTRLRDIFNIQHRIDQSEEKLRKSLLYWLDLVSRRIRSTTFFDGDLIIVIEGANLLREKDRHVETSFLFWLPKVLPKRVRMIITVDDTSYNMPFLRDIGSKFIEIAVHQNTSEQILDYYDTRVTTISEDFKSSVFETLRKLEETHKLSNFYYKIVFTAFFPEGSSEVGSRIHTTLQKNQEGILDVIRTAKTDDRLIEFIIDFYKDKLVDESKYTEVISLLLLNFKGLTSSELCAAADVNSSQLASICSVFDIFILCYKKYMKITNPSFIKIFWKMHLEDFAVRKRVHIKIANTLESSRDSIRKLEEQTNNLFYANEFFSLKQKIAAIENFVILFNEITKFDLFKFWKKLEEKSYDPVQEYNKNFELFVMHFNPNDQQIFSINLQLCLFFKELSDFESPSIPEFRHPFLISKIIQATSESLKLKESAEQIKPPKQYFSINFPLAEASLLENFRSYPALFTGRENDQLPTVEEELKTGGPRVINYLDEIGILKELADLQICSDGKSKFIKEHEKLNVDIPLNRSKFLDHFHGILKKKNAHRFKKIQNESKPFFEVDEGPSEFKLNGNFSEMDNDEPEIDPYTQQIMDIDLAIAPVADPGFYYYKRWIWMNFPWISLARMHQGFSDIIQGCFSRGSSYINHKDEQQRYFSCLLIIEECKLKRASLQTPITSQTNLNFTSPFKKDKLKMPHSETIDLTSSNNGLTLALSPPKLSLAARPIGKSVMGIKKPSFMIKTMTNAIPADLSSKSIVSSLAGLSRTAQSHVLSVIGNSKTNASTVQLEKVLNHSKFLEQSLMRSNMQDMRNAIFGDEVQKENHQAYYTKIGNLDSLFQKWSAKELDLLRRKHDSIIKELNRFSALRNKLLKRIESLAPVEIKQLKQSGAIRPNDVNSKLLVRLRKAEQVRARYQQIEDICLLNQVQNEEWIRTVSFYLSNLKKVRSEKERDVLHSIAMVRNSKHERKKVLENFTAQKARREEFKFNFRKYIFQKANIDKAIILSDKFILGKVQERLDKHQQSEIDAENKKKKTVQVHPKISSELENKYTLIEEQFELVKSIVCSSSPSNSTHSLGLKEDWRADPELQRAAFQIQMGKNLKQAIFEEELKINEHLSNQSNIFVRKPFASRENNLFAGKGVANRLPSVKTRKRQVLIAESVAQLHLSVGSMLDKLSVISNPMDLQYSKEVNLEEVFLKAKLLASSVMNNEGAAMLLLTQFPSLRSHAPADLLQHLAGEESAESPKSVSVREDPRPSMRKSIFNRVVPEDKMFSGNTSVRDENVANEASTGRKVINRFGSEMPTPKADRLEDFDINLLKEEVLEQNSQEENFDFPKSEIKEESEENVPVEAAKPEVQVEPEGQGPIPSDPVTVEPAPVENLPESVPSASERADQPEDLSQEIGQNEEDVAKKEEVVGVDAEIVPYVGTNEDEEEENEKKATRPPSHTSQIEVA